MGKSALVCQGGMALKAILLAAVLQAGAGNFLRSARSTPISTPIREPPNPALDKFKCSCINWRDTYKWGLVTCGSGLEFASIGIESGYPNTIGYYMKQMTRKGNAVRKKAEVLLQTDLCTNFFERLDSTACVRSAMDQDADSWYGQSWCYVTEECGIKNPNISYKVPVFGAKVKMCQKGKDQLLGDLDPVELMQLARKSNITRNNIMLRLAYPVERSIMTATDIGDLVKLEDISDSKKVTVVDHLNAIVAGDKVYQLENNEDPDTLKCMMGCGADTIWVGNESSAM